MPAADPSPVLISSEAKLAQKVQRMIRPEALKKNERLFWSPGTGTDVWEMFCAAISGDLETIRRLLNKDPSLVRAHYEYRTPCPSLYARTSWT